jgi:GT2 family glycosyltransferase
MLPHWQVFALGYEAVKRVGGLFDESFFPAFCEDNDFARRAEHAGVAIRRLEIPMLHDNSSTINSDPALLEKNARTFPTNAEYFYDKCAREDYSAGGWSVERRRLNGWEAGR